MLQKVKDQIPDKVIPDLNKLYDEFHTLGTTLDSKIKKVQSTVGDQGYHAESELISMTKLKECVQSAADIVSTALTKLVPEASEKSSVKYGSDFGDILKKSNEPIQHWISLDTVYEYEDIEAPAPDPLEASTGNALLSNNRTMTRISRMTCPGAVQEWKETQERRISARHSSNLENCLSRFPATSTYHSMTSLQSTSITGVSKAELLELLIETYCQQGAWSEARLAMKEKL